MTNKVSSSNMRTLTPHLVCRDAAAAIDFYKRAFGAEENMRLAGPNGKLMHASVRIGDSMLMLVDEMPEWGSVSPLTLNGTPVSIHLQVPNVDNVMAQAISAGAREVMAATDMFWGDRYGVVSDPFGHKWSIATRIRDMTVDEIIAAGSEFQKSMTEGCPSTSAA